MIQTQNSNTETRNEKKGNQKKIVSGHWSKKEQLLYYIFLYHHFEQFVIDDVRRSLRMFKSMAIFIGTRKPGQCRTHHQKFLRKYGSLQQNIQQYLERTPKFGEIYQRHISRLIRLEDQIFCGDFGETEEISDMEKATEKSTSTPEKVKLPPVKIQESFVVKEEYQQPMPDKVENNQSVNLEKQYNLQYLGFMQWLYQMNIAGCFSK